MPEIESDAKRRRDDSSDKSAFGSTLDRILKNLGRLLAGRAVSALLLLLATMMMARALGPAEFGTVILVHTYVLVWNGILNCKPFEAIIRYGVPALETDNHPQLHRLLRLCLRVDFWTSVIATVCAMLCAHAVGSWLDWNEQIANTAALYSIILMSFVTGTAKGVLRLFDRFDLISRQLTVAPALRCIGVGVAWWQDADLWIYLMIWGSALVLENLYMIYTGWREYKARVRADGCDGPLGDWQSEFSGIKSFLTVVYWQSNLDLLPKHGSTLLVGGLLSATDVGLFRIAREFAAVLAGPAVLLRQVLFPDLSRLWHRGDVVFKQVLIRTVSFAAAVGLAVVGVSLLAAEPLLNAIAGPDYAGAGAVLSWLLLAATLDVCSSALRAGGYAAGQASRLLKINVVATAVYALTFIGAAQWMGLSGVGVAAAVASLLSLIGAFYVLKQKLP